MQNSTLRLATLLLGIAAFPVSGCNNAAAAEDGQTNAQQLFQLCAQCHGADGLGRQSVGAPAIAGLPGWYVETQLSKFDTGLRGTHPDDITGMRMRPMALALPGPEDMKTVAAHVEQLAKHKPTDQKVDGDLERGRAAFSPCVACHGPGAKGNATTKAPPLAGLQDWYIVTQLNHFKAGVRGANPQDLTGAQMRPFAQALSDQDVKDVARYIASLPWYR